MGRGLLSDCFSAKKACAIRFMISRAADIFAFSTYIRAFFLFFLIKYFRDRLFLLGLNGFTSYFSSVIFLCRGLILGSLFYIFRSNYFVSGVIIYLFIVCIQNIIITAGMIVAVTLNYDIAEKPFSCKVKDLIFNFMISFGVCLIGALYELLILVLILRPLLTCF